MPIDLGDNPIGATPTIAQAAQMCTALRVGTGNDVTFNKEAFANSVYPITDVKGASHIVTVTELRNILVTYGMMYQSIWAAANTTI